jgi:glycogen phosphorylase
VSRLHEEVSKKLFTPLFARWPLIEIPIGHVTNGIHVRSWDSSAADTLWTETCGKDLWLQDVEKIEQKMKSIPDEKIWNMRNLARKEMIEYGRAALSKQIEMRGGTPSDVDRAKHQFNVDVFTMGFARRFATYKRPNLLLHDPERLKRILTNPERPAQLVIAGKAHPADFEGKELIRQWMQFIIKPEIRPHIVFVTDYDMSITERLVGGVDLWMNTPRRPWEACGTSGMKILVNGGLNLSELDGWWAESYKPEVGWALGDANEHGNDPELDAKEAEQLYDLLEHQIIPLFYTRNTDGIPTEWVKKVRQSMAELTPLYSTNRAVKEYTEKYYLPMAQNYQKRIANNGKIATEIVIQKNDLKDLFSKLRFENFKAVTKENQHYFEIQLQNAHSIQVQLYAEGQAPIPMKQEGCRFACSVDTKCPITDFTVRAVPFLAQASVPLESSEILWYG